MHRLKKLIRRVKWRNRTLMTVIKLINTDFKTQNPATTYRLQQDF
jgi:hypothetical protein